jgi:soluble lytic murein transglycosylase-like protein
LYTDVLSRISEIQNRMGAIQGRFGGEPEFARTMDKAHGKAAPAAPAAQVADTGPVGGASKAASAAPGPFGSAISEAAARHGVDPDLISAVVKAESNGNPQARSPVGAIGLMQLMPGTARSLGVDPTDPVQNIEGGTRYLGELTKKYGLKEGVAAYNAGPGAVERFGGVPPYKETQAYVQHVLSLYNDAKRK